MMKTLSVILFLIGVIVFGLGLYLFLAEQSGRTPMIMLAGTICMLIASFVRRKGIQGDAG